MSSLYISKEGIHYQTLISIKNLRILIIVKFVKLKVYSHCLVIVNKLWRIFWPFCVYSSCYFNFRAKSGKHSRKIFGAKIWSIFDDFSPPSIVSRTFKFECHLMIFTSSKLSHLLSRRKDICINSVLWKEKEGVASPVVLFSFEYFFFF